MKKGLKLLAVSLTMILGLSTVIPGTTITATAEVAGAAAELPILDTDVPYPSEGCKFVGLEGRYIAECQAALDRLNEIRKEACDTGVIKPGTNIRLKSSDYVPLKWSSDLEKVARIRAAESAFPVDHKRLNNMKPETLNINGICGNCEVLAWNYSKTMLHGIEQWYEEKAAYLKNPGVEGTGHYEAIIMPSFKYVGLGTFYSTKTPCYNTTCGKFSYTDKVLDDTMGTSTGQIIQTLEVSLSSPYYMGNESKFVEVPQPEYIPPTPTPTVKVTPTPTPTPAPSIKLNKTSVTIKKGATFTIKVTKVNTTAKVTYKTSNSNVATVSTKGVIKGVKAGTATITVTCGKLTKKVKVTVKK